MASWISKPRDRCYVLQPLAAVDNSELGFDIRDIMLNLIQCIALSNKMIASTVCSKLARVNFSKANQITKTLGWVQFVVLWKYLQVLICRKLL